MYNAHTQTHTTTQDNLVTTLCEKRGVDQSFCFCFFPWSVDPLIGILNKGKLLHSLFLDFAGWWQKLKINGKTLHSLSGHELYHWKLYFHYFHEVMLYVWLSKKNRRKLCFYTCKKPFETGLCVFLNKFWKSKNPIGKELKEVKWCDPDCIKPGVVLARDGHLVNTCKQINEWINERWNPAHNWQGCELN